VAPARIFAHWGDGRVEVLGDIGGLPNLYNPLGPDWQ
jgi:hypothetical protein